MSAALSGLACLCGAVPRGVVPGYRMVPLRG